MNMRCGEGQVERSLEASRLESKTKIPVRMVEMSELRRLQAYGQTGCPRHRDVPGPKPLEHRELTSADPRAVHLVLVSVNIRANLAMAASARHPHRHVPHHDAVFRTCVQRSVTRDKPFVGEHVVIEQQHHARPCDRDSSLETGQVPTVRHHERLETRLYRCSLLQHLDRAVVATVHNHYELRGRRIRKNCVDKRHEEVPAVIGGSDDGHPR